MLNTLRVMICLLACVLIVMSQPIGAEQDVKESPWLGVWALSIDPTQDETDYLVLRADGIIDSYTAGGQHFEGYYQFLDKLIQATFQVDSMNVGLLFRYDADTDILTLEVGSGKRQRSALYWRAQSLPESLSN